MAHENMDQSGSTQMFQAFVDKPELVSAPSKLPLILGAAAVALVGLGVIAWIALG